MSSSEDESRDVRRVAIHAHEATIFPLSSTSAIPKLFGNPTVEKCSRKHRGYLEVSSSDDDASTVAETPERTAAGSIPTPLLGKFCGMFYVTCSALLFSCAALVVKLATEHFNFAYIVFFRGSLQLILCLITMFAKGYGRRGGYSVLGPKDVRLLLNMRGICGSIAMTLFFMALTSLPIGDASAVFAMQPLFTAIVATIWLGEAWSSLQTLAAIVSSTGALLLAHPSFLPFAVAVTGPQGSLIPASPIHLARWATVCLALLGAVSGAFALNCVRLVGSRADPLHHVFSFGLYTSLLSAALSLFLYPNVREKTEGTPPTGWLLAVSLGVIGFAAQWCLNKGFSMEKAGTAAFLRNLDIAFAYFFQITIVGTPATTLSVSGSALIFVSALCLILEKMRQ